MIREELGEDTTFSDADEFEEACSKLDAPEEVKEKLHKEIGRFKNIDRFSGRKWSDPYLY